MPIWSTASVAEEPVIQLSRRSVARLFQGAAYFAIAYGYRDCERSGRISSPIVAIENGTGHLITERSSLCAGRLFRHRSGRTVRVAHVTSCRRHHRRAGRLGRVPVGHDSGTDARPGQRVMTPILIAARGRIPLPHR